jgi:hypothetical protein
MRLTSNARYLLTTVVILIAGAVQLARGYRPVIVIAGAVGFLFFGNLVIYLFGSKAREQRRKRYRDYYAGKL